MAQVRESWDSQLEEATRVLEKALAVGSVLGDQGVLSSSDKEAFEALRK